MERGNSICRIINRSCSRRIFFKSKIPSRTIRGLRDLNHTSACHWGFREALNLSSSFPLPVPSTDDQSLRKRMSLRLETLINWPTGSDMTQIGTETCEDHSVSRFSHCARFCGFNPGKYLVQQLGVCKGRVLFIGRRREDQAPFNSRLITELTDFVVMRRDQQDGKLLGNNYQIAIEGLQICERTPKNGVNLQGGVRRPFTTWFRSARGPELLSGETLVHNPRAASSSSMFGVSEKILRRVVMACILAYFLACVRADILSGVLAGGLANI